MEAKMKFFALKRKDEKGFAEALSAIVILPLLAYMIFMTFELGFELHYRAAVDSIAQDTIRQVALAGGDGNPRTTDLLTRTARASAGCAQSGGCNSYAEIAQNRLNNLCGVNGWNGAGSRCSTTQGAPTVTCPNYNGVTFGQTLTCTVTFYYKPITSLATNSIASLGFSSLFTKPIIISISAPAAVGQ
jgi:Flp pilus assembly protein TadG